MGFLVLYKWIYFRLFICNYKTNAEVAASDTIAVVKAENKYVNFLNVCKNLEINPDDLTTLDVVGIYEHYGIKDIGSIPNLTFSEEEKHMEK